MGEILVEKTSPGEIAVGMKRFGIKVLKSMDLLETATVSTVKLDNIFSLPVFLRNIVKRKLRWC